MFHLATILVHSLKDINPSLPSIMSPLWMPIAVLLAFSHFSSAGEALGQDDGWTEGHVRGTRLKLFRSEPPMNYYEAQVNCWQEGGHLASFADFPEYEMLVDICNGTNCWIGLYHLQEQLSGLPNYRLYFSDGEPYHSTADEEEHKHLWGRYHIDASGSAVVVGDIPNVNETKLIYEPDNFEHGEGCTEIWFNSAFLVSAGKLNDRPCQSYQLPAHVCKRRDDDEVRTDSQISLLLRAAKSGENQLDLESNTTANCTDGWAPSHNKLAYCVKVFHDELNFTEAQDKCWGKHGRIASFSDVEEFESLKALCNGTECWLGMYHIGERLPTPPYFQLHFIDGSAYAFAGEHEQLWGKYYTKDGEPVPQAEANSTFEIAYEPNTAWEHCTIVRFHSELYFNGDGLLNDIRCNRTIPSYVCERRAGWKKDH